MNVLDTEMKHLVFKLSRTLEKLLAQVAIQDIQLNCFTNEITDLKKRRFAHERYPSEDCFIFDNFPVDTFSENFGPDVVQAIIFYFEYEVKWAAFKPYHPLQSKPIAMAWFLSHCKFLKLGKEKWDTTKTKNFCSSTE